VYCPGDTFPARALTGDHTNQGMIGDKLILFSPRIYSSVHKFRIVSRTHNTAGRYFIAGIHSALLALPY